MSPCMAGVDRLPSVLSLKRHNDSTKLSFSQRLFFLSLFFFPLGDLGIPYLIVFVMYLLSSVTLVLCMLCYMGRTTCPRCLGLATDRHFFNDSLLLWRRCGSEVYLERACRGAEKRQNYMVSDPGERLEAYAIDSLQQCRIFAQGGFLSVPTGSRVLVYLFPYASCAGVHIHTCFVFGTRMKLGSKWMVKVAEKKETKARETPQSQTFDDSRCLTTYVVFVPQASPVHPACLFFLCYLLLS